MPNKLRLARRLILSFWFVACLSTVGKTSVEGKLVTTVAPGSCRYHLEYASSRPFYAKETFSYSYPNFAINELEVAGPIPPDMPSRQQINADLQCSLDSTLQKTIEDGSLKRQMLSLHHWNGTPEHSFQVLQTFQGTLTPCKLARGISKTLVPTLSTSQREAFLSPDREVNFTNTSFQSFLRQYHLVLKEGEDPAEFGYRVYQYVEKALTYGSGGPPHLVTNLMYSDTVCDCGGFATLFTGIMRANGFPSTILVGRWAIPGSPDDPYAQCHVVSQYWIDGVGWCPVDPTPQPDGSNGFGQFRGDFITLHYGIDLHHMQHTHDGKSSDLVMSIAQSPGVWLGTTTAGQHFEPNRCSGTWEVQLQ